MLRQVRQALSQFIGGSQVTATRSTDSEGLLNGDAIFRGGVLFALGPAAGSQLLRELDYDNQVQHLERLCDLRRRELAARAQLETLR